MIDASPLHFISHPQIIAIDNDKKDLNRVTEGLLGIGLPTIPVEYDMVEGLKKPRIWEPQRIRILFLDLNLKDFESPGESISQLASPIEEVLKELSPIGPYIIVFWTKHEGQVSKVMSHIYSRDNNSEVPLPTKYFCIDKIPFTAPQKEQNQNESLREKIKSVLVRDRVFLALMSWESAIEKSAARTIGKIFEMAKSRQEDGTSLDDNRLVDVLKNIATAAWGKEAAKNNPGGAIAHGLSPLLVDHMDGMIDENNYSEIWSEITNNGWNRNLPRGVTAASLNTYCLVDLNCQDPRRRGIWMEFSASGLRKRKFWQTLFGSKKNDLIDEFINSSCIGNKALLKNVRLGLLEFTAACDRANNKAPLFRYVLCARIPAHLDKYICWRINSQKTITQKHDSIHRIETIILDDAEYILFLNYKYVIALPPSHELMEERLINPIFRIRGQVLTDIAHRYASHTNRPGIYSFQSKRNR